MNLIVESISTTFKVFEKTKKEGEAIYLQFSGN